VKILGVLQNQWFEEPERVRSLIERRPEIRSRFIARALFAGCKTGRILLNTFGDLCALITWEEASPRIGGQASAAFPPDLDHLRAVLEREQPDIVIAFGRIAERGLRPLVPAANLICAPHPAARVPWNIPLLLRGVAAEVRSRIYRNGILGNSIKVMPMKMTPERFAELDAVLKSTYPKYRFRWCTPPNPCGCMGCCSRNGARLIEKGFTREEWEEWCAAQPDSKEKRLGNSASAEPLRREDLPG
jgi:hypothetical protein